MPIYGRVALCYFINGYGLLSFFLATVSYEDKMYAKLKAAWIQIGGKTEKYQK